MPPRLQLLTPALLARPISISSRAAFTTSARLLAAPPISTRRAPTPGNETTASRILALVEKSSRYKGTRMRGAAPSAFPRDSAEELERHKQAVDLTKQIARRWRAGDVYAPHDLSSAEMRKWKTRGKPSVDVLDVLQLDPLVEYRNFSMLSEYVTPMGRIKHSRETGLRNVNQRRMAKAIRRMVGMGFMPSVHRHPEILMKESTRRNEQLSRVTKM